MQPSTTPRRRRGKQPKDVVRRLRETAGLSQAELARRAGLSRSLICEIESGRRGITASTRARIADVFDVPTDTLAAAA